MCACVRACVYTSRVWIWTHRRPAVPDIYTSSDCMYTSCSAVEVTMYDAPLRWVGLHDGGGPHPPLLQYIHREPGAGHVGEWGCSVGDECVLIASLPSGAQQGCACLRAPPTPHHSGLFLGRRQLKLRKKWTTLTCGVWYVVCCLSSGLRAFNYY